MKSGYRITIYTPKSRIVTYIASNNNCLMDRMNDLLSKQCDSHYISEYEISFGMYEVYYLGKTFVHC